MDINPDLQSAHCHHLKIVTVRFDFDKAQDSVTIEELNLKIYNKKFKIKKFKI